MQQQSQLPPLRIGTTPPRVAHMTNDSMWLNRNCEVNITWLDGQLQLLLLLCGAVVAL